MENVVFRADSSRHIGSGHVMRCLALGESLMRNGARTHFICRDLPGHMAEFIKGQGHAVHLLPAAETDAGTDATQSLEAIRSVGDVDAIVVDNYALGADWERRMRSHARSIFVVDDLADRPHDCDVLLDQNLVAEAGRRYVGLVPDHCQLLIGPRYALLRKEFQEARANLARRGGAVRRMLLFFGGADPGNLTGMALNAVDRLGRPGIQVDVVAGAANTHSAELRRKCESMPGVQFHQAVTNMAELMAAADLSVGAGGITTWERACLGLPAIVVPIADNQRLGTAAMAASGRILKLDPARATPELICKAIEVVIENPELLQYMQQRNSELVDGKGVMRALRRMGSKPALTLRRATASDCRPIFEWRNAEEARRYSLDPTPLSYEGHRQWFDKALADACRVMLVAEQQGQSIGVLRFDLAGRSARISILVGASFAGQGAGVRMIRAGKEWLRAHYPGTGQIVAEVLSGNSASLAVFQEAGFENCGTVFRAKL